jgi:hypothetical protein
MIDPEVRVQIRRYFYAEHWKVGTIAQALGVHPDTVKRAIEVERFHRAEQLRATLLDPYLPLVRQTLEAHPRLRATRLQQMLRDRGYRGSIQQVRRVVARLRPRPQEAFLRLQVFVGEQAQVDWASFGTVMVGRAKRALSCFVMTLSWSRALYLEFFFDQTMEILTAYKHGMRASEVCNLRVDDLDLKNCSIVVERLKGSLRTTQAITEHRGEPLLNELRALREWLRERQADGSDYLFTSQKGGRLDRTQFFRLFRAIACKAGLPAEKQHPHALKHSLASHLVSIQPYRYRTHSVAGQFRDCFA